MSKVDELTAQIADAVKAEREAWMATRTKDDEMKAVTHVWSEASLRVTRLKRELEVEQEIERRMNELQTK